MSEDRPEYKCFLSAREIEAILPHRYPFLLVDKVIHLDLELNEIIGLKNVTVNEPFFQGHFPGIPIMPGVLILEAIAQTGGILVHQKGHVGKIAVLANVKSAKFRRPVVPGDTLLLHIKGLHISPMGGKIEAKVLIGSQLAAEAELSFVMRNKDKI